MNRYIYQSTRLHISVDIVEQTSLATGNGNDVVDAFPGEGLAVDSLLFA